MSEKPSAIMASAVRDLFGSWRSLAITDAAYKLASFALLTPGVFLLLRWLTSGSQHRVVADADIARFFLTTRAGVLALLAGAALLLAITALEAVGLMAIGFAATRGTYLSARGALMVTARHAPNVLRLAARLVLLVLAGLLPFLGALGLVYWALLRQNDINYYLAERPSVFWVALALAAVIAIVGVMLILWGVARWALALPLVLFEHVSPRRALGESARRSQGHRSVILLVLVGWAVVALALAFASGWLVEGLGRILAPHLASSLASLLVFVAGLALLWAVVGLAVGIANFSLFSLLIVRLYLLIGDPRVPVSAAASDIERPSWRPSRRVVAGLVAVAVLAALGVAWLAFLGTSQSHPVLVIAHRGSSSAAPENTLAAFRLAAEQGADFVELDVQESADGEVVVVHDSDLMKVGHAAMKIWETDAAQLRSVDIGSHAGPQFSGERVPTLAEALAVCKGRSKVIVELKSYGHDQQLEERVAAIVEAAGMEHDCMFMSLDHHMVDRMKRLRPKWTCGVLVARAVGDLTALGADFVAVEARMATGPFIRRAHRAGQDVYVWTLNDPAWMLAAMGRGVDGLITDQPELARKVIARRTEMSDGQRFLVALLVRLGARVETLASEDALRP